MFAAVFIALVDTDALILAFFIFGSVLLLPSTVPNVKPIGLYSLPLLPDARFFYFTTKGRHRHSDVAFRDGDFLVFGKETKGIPEDILYGHYDDCVRIPMRENLRSLNLSNAAAIAVYEVLRQHSFAGLVDYGKMKD